MQRNIVMKNSKDAASSSDRTPLAAHFRRVRANRHGMVPAMLLVAGQALAFFAPAVFSSTALAQPRNPRVVAGSASFSQNGNVTTVLAANRTIINYSSFNIAAGQTVRFIQPSANSAVLNRVLSMMPTTINGTLQSNGIVYVVNPAGIIFGQGAIINAGQFVAAAAHMNDADFLNSRNVFTTAGGRVENFGRIEGSTGVSLVGGQVANFGTVVSPQGSVVMAAGDRVLIGERAGRVFAQVTTDTNKTDSRGSVGIENSGTVAAPRGRVVMGAGDLYATAIRTNKGSVIQARGVEITAPTDTADGKRPDAGRVILSGTIDARGTEPGQRGGDVTVTGSQIGLLGATIDASGSAGGGVIRIGGDAYGSGDMARSSATFVDVTSVVRADAIDSGNGGTIIFWGDGALRFFGTATATGGNGGNGGFIETSGHSGLTINPLRMDASAGRGGRAGTWLIDPYDIEITTASDLNFTFTPDGSSTGGLFEGTGSPSQISASAIEAQLLGGTTVTITTAGAGTDPGNITVNAPITFTGTTAAELRLIADGFIRFNQNITATAAPLALTLTSGNGVNVANNSSIDLFGGAFTSTNTGGNFDMDPGTSLRAGSITLNQSGSVVLIGVGTTTFTDVNIVGNLTVSNSGGNIVRANGGTFIVGGNLNATTTTLNDSINLRVSSGSQAAITGEIALSTAGTGNATLTNQSDVILAASTIGGNFDVTTLSGSISNSGNVAVTGTSLFTAATAGQGVNLGAGAGTFASGGELAVVSGGDSTIVGTGALVFSDVEVGGNFTVSNSGGNISRADGGAFTVGGDFAATTTTGDDSITLRVATGTQANITGTIGLNTAGAGNATLTNQGDIVLAASTVGGNADLLSASGSISNTGNVAITGTTTASAAAANQTISLGVNAGTFSATGVMALNSGSDATVVNQVATTLGASTIGGDLTVTSINGNINGAASTVVTVNGGLNLEASEPNATITLNNLAVIGPITFNSAGSGGDVTITNASAIVLGASNIGGNLTATATTGGITQAGDVVIDGSGISTLTANGTSNNIVIGNTPNAFTLSNSAASLSLNTAGTGNVTGTLTAVNLAASNVGGNLGITTTTGNITQSGILTVGGTTTASSAAAIDLSTSQNLFAGALLLTSVGSASITNNRATVLGLSLIGSGLTVTSAGALTDSGIVTITGNSEFTTTGAASNITLDQLAATGSVGLFTTGAGSNATIVNATALILAESSVLGTLNATATLGTITQNGNLTSAGGIFTTTQSGQAITLTDATNSFTGALSFNTNGAGGNVTLQNSVGTILAGSTISGNLDVLSLTGNISRTGTTPLTVSGSANLVTTAAGASINHNGLAVTGPIRVNTGATGGSASITNATAVVLGISDMVVGGALSVTATTGDVTDAVAVSSLGQGTFTATSNVGNIILDNTTATSLSFNTTSGGVGGNATYTAATGNVVLNTSDVGRTLTVTASNGSITSETGVTIRVRGSGTGVTATSDVALLTARGPGGSITLSGLTINSGRLTASADQSISLTGTTGQGLNVGNITAGAVAGSGDAATPASILISAITIGLGGNLTTNRGNITLSGGPVRLLNGTNTISSRYTGSASAGSFNGTSFGTITFNGDINSGASNGNRSLLIRTPNGNQYSGGTASVTMPIVVFNGQNIGSASQPLGSLLINEDLARVNQPAAATIFAGNSQGLRIFLGTGSQTGVFNIGSGERITTLGNFSLSATSAIFGDFNTLGSANFNVTNVTVRRRAGSAIAFANPGELQIDGGTDLIFAGGLSASNPAGWGTIDSGASPVIATRDGSPITSAEFVNVLLNGNYPTAADAFVDGNRPADFSTGQTNLRLLTRPQSQISGDAAGSILPLNILEPTAIEGSPSFANGTRAAFVSSALIELGVPLTAIRTGDRVIFERTTSRPTAGDARSGIDRFTDASLNVALTTLDTVQSLPSETASQLQEAFSQYAQVRAGGVPSDPVGFAAWLATRGDLTLADAAVTALAEHFRALGDLGLSPSEAAPARLEAVKSLTSGWATDEDRIGLIRAAESRRLGRLASR